MFLATLLVVPLILLIKPTHHIDDDALAHAAMD
jgi:DHA2 family multidrug resistance protein